MFQDSEGGRGGLFCSWMVRKRRWSLPRRVPSAEFQRRIFGATDFSEAGLPFAMRFAARLLSHRAR